MSKFQVRVNLVASAGIAKTKTVEVEAQGKAEALVKAFFVLDKQGIDRWSLDTVSEMTS